MSFARWVYELTDEAREQAACYLARDGIARVVDDDQKVDLRYGGRNDDPDMASNVALGHATQHLSITAPNEPLKQGHEKYRMRRAR